MTHTPGPWKLEIDKPTQRPDGKWFNTIWAWTADHEKIVFYDHFETQEEKANIILRAAAPDLLEACDDLIKYYVGIGLEDDEDGEPNPILVKARAAIAKAKGKHGKHD